MLKFAIKRPKGPLIGFGLSHMNLEKLKAGLPIKINLEQFGLQGEVFIFAGETEKAMAEDLKKEGLLPADFDPNTMVL